NKPRCAFSLDRTDKLAELLPQADVLVLAAPLTESNLGLIGRKQLQTLKPTALLVSVGSPQVLDTGSLVAALERKELAGAGLDKTDPSPLPPDHPLLRTTQVVLARPAGRSPEAADREWRLYRENVRRFVSGERLLGVVEAGR